MRTNPKKVKKPVIKKWCYTPTEESGLVDETTLAPTTDLEDATESDIEDFDEVTEAPEDTETTTQIIDIEDLPAGRRRLTNRRKKNKNRKN